MQLMQLPFFQLQAKQKAMAGQHFPPSNTQLGSHGVGLVVKLVKVGEGLAIVFGAAGLALNSGSGCLPSVLVETHEPLIGSQLAQQPRHQVILPQVQSKQLEKRLLHGEQVLSAYRQQPAEQFWHLVEVRQTSQPFSILQQSSQIMELPLVVVYIWSQQVLQPSLVHVQQLISHCWHFPFLSLNSPTSQHFKDIANSNIKAIFAIDLFIVLLNDF